jgi:CheY-like chemotaxis protein
MPAVLESARTYCGRLEDVVGSPPSSWRILLVDDNRDFADCLAAMLRRGGHTIRVTYDGRTAIQAARPFRPQIVFSDLGLPGLTGHEVARSLRNDPLLEGVYLVALTGFDGEDDHRAAQEAGFNAFLTKPVDFADVQEVLDKLLKPLAQHAAIQAPVHTKEVKVV